MLKVGDLAPDFPVGETTLYRLLEQRSVAVFFFPMTFTPTCTREARAFGDEFDNLRQAGCDLVGVSKGAQARSDEFARSLGLPFPLVGDDGTIVRAYEVAWPLVGLARRVTYLIGQDRRVRSVVHAEFDVAKHITGTCSVLRPGS
jgi:peroxiredoxin